MLSVKEKLSDVSLKNFFDKSINKIKNLKEMNFSQEQVLSIFFARFCSCCCRKRTNQLHVLYEKGKEEVEKEFDVLYVLKQNRIVKQMIKNVTDPVQLYKYKNSKVKVINLKEESSCSSQGEENEKVIEVKPLGVDTGQ